MKIGVFDSGLGGMLILRSLARDMPEYDYVYLGDTQRAPYGNRSQDVIRRFLEEAVDFLFRQGCGLVIVACNTASAEALRTIQRGYLQRHYPGVDARHPKRRILGIIIPTAEEALKDDTITRVGVLATQATTRSHAYSRELKKINPRVRVFEEAAPLLVPLIENDATRWAKPILSAYLAPLLVKKVQVIILGCTHYPALKGMIRRMAGGRQVISQDEIISRKLKRYLARHPEIDKGLRKNHRRELLVTDITPIYERLVRQWFGTKVKLKRAVLQPTL